MGYTLDIEASELFERTYNASTRFVCSYGGTRSGKSFSILQSLIVKALSSQETKIVSVVRKSFPSLRLTIMKDFFDILEMLKIYEEKNHNKSDHTYQLGKWEFQFFSIDDPAKKRGAKRSILYINEATELDYESFFQLQIRTTDQVILDWNPSMVGWINEKVLTDPDCTVIHSTYKDNPFLPEGQIKEIEKLKDVDEQYYKIYALGEYAGNVDLIYSHTVIDGIPYEKIERGEIKLIALGMDWGFSNDPTVVVEVYKEGDNLYLNELLYEKGLTNNDIVEKLKGLGVDRYTEIIADSAEPKSIEELHRMRFNIKPAKKGPDSIKNGIDILRRHKIYITAQSTNLIRELNNYKYITDKDGNALNKPVDAFNHGMDAIRYVALNKLSEARAKGQYNIRIINNGVYAN